MRSWASSIIKCFEKWNIHSHANDDQRKKSEKWSDASLHISTLLTCIWAKWTFSLSISRISFFCWFPFIMFNWTLNDERDLVNYHLVHSNVVHFGSSPSRWRKPNQSAAKKSISSTIQMNNGHWRFNLFRDLLKPSFFFAFFVNSPLSSSSHHQRRKWQTEFDTNIEKRIELRHEQNKTNFGITERHLWAESMTHRTIYCYWTHSS